MKKFYTVFFDEIKFQNSPSLKDVLFVSLDKDSWLEIKDRKELSIEEYKDVKNIFTDKEDGYITRLNQWTDNDNQSKTLQYLRDDLNLYLRDLDELNVTELEDTRPQYENKSEGYLKIRNLNQAIIIRKEEGDDVGLIGEDPENPKWMDDGFTISMWVKFKDRVNGGTLFNFGNFNFSI